ncbi:CKL1, partial [Symbiodinium microadriaticum]
MSNDETKVAVKFEKHGSRCPQLRHEYKVYREVASCHGFCRVHHFGTQDNYNVMVMDLLGPSLEDLFNRCGRRFSLKTVLQLADQLLERVDTFHSRHLIHRDIKPANFVIGTGETSNIVYCVDFGLSKRYRHPKNLQHIPHRDGRSLTGTPRYASINNHLGIEQSRRDDLESVAYVLVYFLKGSLPWQGLKAKNAQKKYRLILEKKQQVSIAQLCAGCPSQFAEFLAYTRALKFDTKPDIPFLRKMFRDLYHAQGCANSGKLWDWDSADADAMMTGSDVPAGSGAPPVMPGDPEVGGFDAKRGTTAGTGARPAAVYNQSPSRPDSAAETYDTKTPNVTSRSAGSGLLGDGKGAGGERTRPHSAHVDSAHVGGGTEENGHVVAGARAMMLYRRTRDPQVGAGAAGTGGGSGDSKRWANNLFPAGEAKKTASGTGRNGSANAPRK